MTALSGPWAEAALLLRQARDGLPLWLFGLPLFLSVCLLLLQLIVYLGWKLRQVEADLEERARGGSATYRQVGGHAHLRRRRSRSEGSHSRA